MLQGMILKCLANQLNECRQSDKDSVTQSPLDNILHPWEFYFLVIRTDYPKPEERYSASFNVLEILQTGISGIGIIPKCIPPLFSTLHHSNSPWNINPGHCSMLSNFFSKSPLPQY